MDQQIINWSVAAFGCISGFLLHVIWDAVKDLQKTDKELALKVSEVEVLVAGSYVTRGELTNYMDTIFLKLDIITDKIAAKADK
jgi:hypothetical protein